MVKVFDSLKRLKLQIATGCLICLGEDVVPLKENVYALPVGQMRGLPRL
jgi:hypothetical protein